MLVRNFTQLSLIALTILIGAVLPATANSGKIILRGDCGRRSCKAVLKELRQLYPEYVAQYEKECPRPEILGLDVGFNRQKPEKVALYCWNAKKDQGTRYGIFLGILPLKNNESGFLAIFPSDSPHSTYLLQKYPQDVKKARFKCATKAGSLLIATSEADRTVQLQCYFQGGSQPLDENGDFKSDGEVSRGASVDEILGTFPAIN